ncbi:hypothetical protein E8E12_002995 [Didymella heteroderae]|uniref:Uncharacterized protein n=1 Tax=Didymella heteroderae TaxID=1769908 RepID=A0A9P5C1Z6_9PLEO|nr:hypothetical protein E8E12_002995 [Didymella heteroderae]
MRTMLFHTTLLALTTYVRAASQIALFTDSNCQDSYKGLEGPNGYPNGSCTDIRRSGEYGSLQVVGLDPGCAVTIYVDDTNTTICGGYQEEIQLGQCWNSTFVYYSIDMCDLPSSSSTPSSKDTTSNAPTTGTLVGAILGGLAGGALLLGFALWVLARKKRARKARDAAAAEQSRDRDHAYAEVETNPYRTEMDASYQRHEMEQGMIAYKHAAAEVATPPVELGGFEVGRDARHS